MAQLAGFLFLVFSWCAAQENYPKLTEIVTDNAQIFTQPQLEELRDKLYQFESETTNQVVILTINELGNETIEQYANGAFNQNKLGQEGKIKSFGVKKLTLIGSYASGRAKVDSDIDFLVEFSKPVGWKFLTLNIYLEKLFNRKRLLRRKRC